jgi:hypothetical protein
MLPRLRRRRLWRRFLLGVASLALFALGIWLALTVAGYSPPRVVRVLPGGSRSAPPYSVDESGQTLRVRQQVGPGQEQEFEIKNTGEGVLVRPARGRQ